MENIKSKKLLKLSIVLVLLTAMFVGSAVPAQAASKYISKSKAITIATKNAKVNKNSKKFRLDDADLERKGKTRVWDIEFYSGGMEYEYEINAKTGEIIEWDIDRD